MCVKFELELEILVQIFLILYSNEAKAGTDSVLPICRLKSGRPLISSVVFASAILSVQIFNVRTSIAFKHLNV